MKLEWNLGGWLGSQIGGTAWIGVAAILAGIQNLTTGLVLFGIFLIPNIIGLVLWRRRDRMPCYPAMQTVIFSAGSCGLLAVYVLENRGQWESIQSGGTVSSGSAYWVIVLVVSILMLNFHLRFGRESG
ncbi:MAG: hypothetical protein QNJ40_20440 [Xanthomonadales bacterium]|nr:hypothetical protein [Xanthomonadales bacterium]